MARESRVMFFAGSRWLKWANVWFFSESAKTPLKYRDENSFFLCLFRGYCVHLQQISRGVCPVRGVCLHFPSAWPWAPRGSRACPRPSGGPCGLRARNCGRWRGKCRGMRKKCRGIFLFLRRISEFRGRIPGGSRAPSRPCAGRPPISCLSNKKQYQQQAGIPSPET